MGLHHPLAGVVEKLRNADDHLHRLKAGCLAYLESGVNASILAERDPDDSGSGRMRLRVLQEPPLKLAAIAGDVVHNLRSSLDYIIEELVKLEGTRPTVMHQFPICTSPDNFTAEMKKGRVYGVSVNAVTAVEGFQPYQVKPEARGRHPLLHLHKLSNHDKHHMLAIAALNGSFRWKFVDRDGRVLRSEESTEAVLDGGVLAELPTGFMIDGAEAQLDAQLTLTIGFSGPLVVGFDVLGCLQSIRKYIGIVMVPAFAKFFDPRPDDLLLTSHGIADETRHVVPLDAVVRPADL